MFSSIAAMPLLLVAGAILNTQGAHDYAVNPPSYTDFEEIESLVVAEIVLSTCPDEADVVNHWDWDGGTDCTEFPRDIGNLPLAPRLVRLAFHDATGAMDGFLNMNDPEHAGLQPAINVMESLHAVGQMIDGRLISDVVSLADLFSWAGIAAVRFTADRGDDPFVPLIPVRYGRETYAPVDDADVGPDETFPEMSALSTGEQLVTYFGNKFGFSAADTVTLMGAHSLGQARSEHSGFRGPWDDTLLVMDEEYYSAMVHKVEDGLLLADGSCAEAGRCEGWEQVRIGNRRSGIYQWRHSCDDTGSNCAQLMLNVDMGLLIDLDSFLCGENDVFTSTGTACVKGEVKGFPADSTCTWGDRLLASCFNYKDSTSTTVLTNADPNNRDAWLVEFARVFDEMMTVSSAQSLVEVLDTEAPTSSPTSSPTRPPTFVPKQPNFIIMQPDDMLFFEDWTPPAHFPTNGNNDPAVEYPAGSTLPNINRLRLDGLQMMQAYTASAKCGTSRYSTITGRYPSRSSFGRDHEAGLDVAYVDIPTSKLQDTDSVSDGDDCAAGNLAALFKANQYRTGVVGKWHLTKLQQYTYEGIQSDIRDCGFDFAEAIYPENLDSGWDDPDEFSHNMEYITYRAIEFIESSTEPFFLYVNPTAPHSSGNVQEALVNYTCTHTPNPVDPSEEDMADIPGMTADYGGDCAAYRQSVIDRAAPSTSNNDLGSIWVDDAVGALLASLERTGQLDNTFFLFQLDHGQEGKNSLYEGGIRIPQFIHYPEGWSGGKTFEGPVSTIDIGPTIADYAGIDDSQPGWYEMDGKSWKGAVDATMTTWDTERCMFHELGGDRAVECGCDKYIYMPDWSSGTSPTATKGGNDLANAEQVWFNLCDDNSDYLSAESGEDSPEVTESASMSDERKSQLVDLVSCHLDKTDPDKFPFYYDCETGWTSHPTQAPTASPTQAPTASPTPVPIVCEDDLVPFQDGQGRDRDCEWVTRVDTRCEWNRYGQYCPKICGHCTV